MRAACAALLLLASPAGAADLSALGPGMTRWPAERLATAARPAAPAEDGFARFGRAMKYALPAAAAVCAAQQHRLEDFAARALLNYGLVWGLKQALGDAPVSRRPTGEGEGFPSGHAASAFFGAADLSGKCWEERPSQGAAALSAAALTGASRVQAGEHTAPQVGAGALIGLGLGGASFGIGGDGAGFSLGLRF